MKVSLGEIKFWIGRAANRPFIFGFDSPQFRFYFFYLLDYSLQLRKCQFSLMDIFQFRNKIFLYILSFSVDWLFEYSADWRPMDSYFHIENSDDNDHLENYKMIVEIQKIGHIGIISGNKNIRDGPGSIIWLEYSNKFIGISWVNFYNFIYFLDGKISR